jgi:hypothetical protein
MIQHNLIGSNSAGCTNELLHKPIVTVNPLPTANFDHTGPACLNEEVEFTNLSSSPNGTIEIWEWKVLETITRDQWH